MKRRIIATVTLLAMAAAFTSAATAPAEARKSGYEQQRCFKTYCRWRKKRHCMYRRHCGIEQVCSTTLVRCER